MSLNLALKNRYILHEKVGEGGMAEVYRATHIQLDREVAIKLIRPSFNDTLLLARFQQEARAIARLNHPHILHVYDFDETDDGRYFMATEYLPGGDLQTRLDQSAWQGEHFSLRESIMIVKSVAMGLQYAHEAGVIHRDVKPSNIFIASNERVVVGDFGLAKLVGSDLARSRPGSGLIGTPLYLSPEQISEQPIDHRADIYSLGAVLYLLLTGDIPYRGASLVEILSHHLHSSIPDPRKIRPELPQEATSIVHRAMAKNPAQRYASMSELISDLNVLDSKAPVGEKTILLGDLALPVPRPSWWALQTLLSTSQIPGLARRKWWGVAVVGIALVLAALTYLVWPKESDGKTASQVVSPVTPAQAGQTLVLVAPMVDAETGIDVASRIADQLRTGTLGTVLQNSLRIEMLEEPIDSERAALAIGRASDASLVIWGRSDAAGWQIGVNAPNHADETLQALSITALRGATFALTMVEQVPLVAEYYSKVLVMAEMMARNDVVGVFILTFTIEQFEPAGLGLGATPLDDNMLQLINHLRNKEGFEADATATEVLSIAPRDPVLHYFRWLANLVGGQRDLANREIERMAAISDGNTLPQTLLVVTAFLFGDIQQIEATVAPLEFESNSASTMAHSLSYQGMVQQGRFAEALAEITAFRAWLQDHNDPTAPTIFLDSLVFLQLIRGDNAAVERLVPDYKDWRESRFYREGNRFFRELQPDHYAPIAFSIGGYGEEVAGQPTVAQLTYAFGLSQHPNDFVLNWRQATYDIEKGDFQQAYGRYDTAVENAPVPFPIARFDQAMLVLEHGDALDNPRSLCALLEDAQIMAGSDAVFYAVLLERIEAAKSAAGCSSERFEIVG